MTPVFGMNRYIAQHYPLPSPLSSSTPLLSSSSPLSYFPPWLPFSCPVTFPLPPLPSSHFLLSLMFSFH